MTVNYPDTPTPVTPYFAGIKADDIQGPADGLTITVDGKPVTLSTLLASPPAPQTAQEIAKLPAGTTSSGTAQSGTTTDPTASQTPSTVELPIVGATTVYGSAQDYLELTVGAIFNSYAVTTSGPLVLALPQAPCSGIRKISVLLKQGGNFPVQLPQGVVWETGYAPIVAPTVGITVPLRFTTVDGITWVGGIGL